MGINDKYSDIYNKAYRFVTPDFLDTSNEESLNYYLAQNNESLLKFLTQYFSDRGGLDSLAGKDILEAGCGLGGLSHKLFQFGAKMNGVDISSLAISAAKEISMNKRLDLEFFVGDVASELSLNKKYDFIVDSHLLHCLTAKDHRANYFKFVRNHLKDDGIFIVETATFEDEIREPIGYEIDQDYTLYQEIGGERFPVRKLIPARGLESELIQYGFDIHTFFYHYELSFNVFPEIKNYPVFRLPKTVRYSAKVSQA